MAVEPGSWVHHIVYHECRVVESSSQDCWFAQAEKEFLLPGLGGYENFLLQQVRRFARLSNTMSGSSNLGFAFLQPEHLFMPLECLVVIEYTLQTIQVR